MPNSTPYQSLKAPCKVRVGGLLVDQFTGAQLAERMLADWQARAASDHRPKVGSTANGQVISLAASNPAFRSKLLECDYVAPDGMSVVVASRLFATPLPERVATTDWFHEAARTAAQHGIKFFMLGGAEAANAQAVENVVSLHPGLQVVGRHHGYFEDSELPSVVEKIRRSGADIVWVALGNPRQLFIAYEIARRLPSLTWVRTCGGLFDFLSGDRRRAPQFLQRLGLEWSFRLFQEPRRLFWRYLTTNIHSTWLLLSRTGSPRAAAKAR